MEIEKILEEAVSVGAEQLILDYNARDFNTTGELKDSIHSVGGRILAKRYIFDLIYGQKPSFDKFQNWRFGSRLHTWTAIKITNNENETIGVTQNTNSVAFLVARRLFDEGDQIYRKERDPLDTKMTKSVTIESFREKIRMAYKNKIKQHNDRK